MRGFRLPPAIKAEASTQTLDFQGTRSFHQNRDCLGTPGFPSRKELTAAIKAGASTQTLDFQETRGLHQTAIVCVHPGFPPERSQRRDNVASCCGMGSRSAGGTNVSSAWCGLSLAKNGGAERIGGWQPAQF